MTSGGVGSWEEFRGQNDLLFASHRGLQRCLIPQWLRDPKSLGERIESSAYGETPPDLIEIILQTVQVSPNELFVDLGCGAGNVCASALQRGARVLGIERNPELLAAAENYLGHLISTRLELRCADFLKTDWSAAEIAYSTTARLPQSVLAGLAHLCDRAPALRAFACLGRALPLDQGWSVEDLGPQAVVWNPGEACLTEPLLVYRRSW